MFKVLAKRAPLIVEISKRYLFTLSIFLYSSAVLFSFLSLSSSALAATACPNEFGITLQNVKVYSSQFAASQVSFYEKPAIENARKILSRTPIIRIAGKFVLKSAESAASGSCSYVNALGHSLAQIYFVSPGVARLRIVVPFYGEPAYDLAVMQLTLSRTSQGLVPISKAVISAASTRTESHGEISLAETSNIILH